MKRTVLTIVIIIIFSRPHLMAESPQEDSRLEETVIMNDGDLHFSGDQAIVVRHALAQLRNPIEVPHYWSLDPAESPWFTCAIPVGVMHRHFLVTKTSDGALLRFAEIAGGVDYQDDKGGFVINHSIRGLYGPYQLSPVAIQNLSDKLQSVTSDIHG